MPYVHNISHHDLQCSSNWHYSNKCKKLEDLWLSTPDSMAHQTTSTCWLMLCMFNQQHMTSTKSGLKHLHVSHEKSKVDPLNAIIVLE